MDTAVLLLGSNLGDRVAYLDHARGLITGNIGRIVRSSAVYETAPWGNENQAVYLNQVITVETALSPSDTMKMILKIEHDLGRIRTEKWAPRIIDIDILFFGNQIVQQPDLIVPHPYLHQRRFVLEPLVEILPDFVHPVLNKTVSQLYNELTDTSTVVKTNYV